MQRTDKIKTSTQHHVYKISFGVHLITSSNYYLD